MQVSLLYDGGYYTREYIAQQRKAFVIANKVMPVVKPLQIVKFLRTCNGRLSRGRYLNKDGQILIFGSSMPKSSKTIYHEWCHLWQHFIGKPCTTDPLLLRDDYEGYYAQPHEVEARYMSDVCSYYDSLPDSYFHGHGIEFSIQIVPEINYFRAGFDSVRYA